MQQAERRRRIAFEKPWADASSSEQLTALAFAAEIIFYDGSAVRWNGIGWDVDLRYLLVALVNPEADLFMEERYKVAKQTPL